MNAMLHLVLFVPGALTLALAFKVVRGWVRQSALRRIPGPPSPSFIVGNFEQLFHPIVGYKFHDGIIQKFGRIVRLSGFFGDTMLYVSDPQALQHIVLKDQHIYEESDGFCESTGLLFGHQGILSTRGDHHRRQRKLLNPVFSVAHMRAMAPIFRRITNDLRDILVARTAAGPAELDMLAWTTRLALELIGQGGLGHSFDALNEEGKSDAYGSAVKALIPALSDLTFLQTITPHMAHAGPASLRRWLAHALPWPAWQRLVGSVDTMDACARDVLASKLKDGIDGADGGKDIMSVLMRAQSQEGAERLSEVELLAQVNVLIFAAMDTTTSALSRLMHVLAAHPDAQARLRAELVVALDESPGELEYDVLNALPYLEAVVRETLRLYPPFSIIFRTARTAAVLPTTAGPIHIPANTDVVTSIYGLNRDPQLWGADAAVWRPERWLAPLPAAVGDAGVPGVYANTLSFYGGGRSCIGFKFALLEIKTVLATLLPALRLAPPKDATIEWRMGPISSPGVKGQRESCLPLLVARV